ncbi:MAG: MDR family MFS transporter [Chloroflexia bacterium]
MNTGTRSKYAIALTAALGLIMAVLDATIVNVALVPIANSFNTDLNSIEWVVTGYLLAQAAVIPVAGYFSNRFGIKRLFIICLSLFTVGSVLCGLSQSETQLIVFRVMQGLGGGALFPLSQALAFGAFPPRERAAASAIVAIPVLLAPAFGPTLGGWLTDTFGWSSIFFVNLPVGILAIGLASWVLPRDRVPERSQQPSFDYPGLALVTLGVLAVVYSFTLVSQTRPGSRTPANPAGELYGWSYEPVWGILVLGLLLLTAFAIYELRFSKDPVLDLRLFTRYDYTIASVVSWVNAAVVFGSLILLPIFLQQVRNPPLTALDAGLALMPQGLAAAVSVAIGGRLYNVVGVRVLVMVGAALLTLSSWMLTQVTPTTDGAGLLPALVVRGLGFGFTLIPVQTMALESITGPALAKASSLYNVTRQIFSSIGVAMVITLFVQQTNHHATQLIEQARRSVPAGTQFDLNNPLVQKIIAVAKAQAGTAGMQDVFTMVMIGTTILFLVSLALPGREAQERRRAAREIGAAQPVIAE